MRQPPLFQKTTTTAPPAPAAQTTPAAPVAQAGGLPPANADLQTLQNALGELRIQESGLNAQWRSLRDQVGDMRLDNPARPQIQQQLADVGTELAQVRGNIEVVRGRIAKQTGRYVSETGQPASPPRRGPDPDMVFGMSLGIIMIVAVPLSIAYARRIWRGKPAPGIPHAEEIPGRLERLEHAVDTIAIEIERISEGQRFITKIMAERPAQQPASPGEDARPIRALGAGPIEPVRANERQGVKQSVTPH